MTELFCFSCGREIPGPLDAGQAAICDRCRARHDPEAASQLFVRRVGNPEEGPLSREAVDDQLSRSLLGPEDRVREEDGPWQRIDQHPWFAGYFVAGDPRNEKLQLALRARGKEQEKLRRSGTLQKGMRFFIGAGSVFAVAGVLASIPFWIQDAQVKEMASMGGEAVDKAVLSTRKALDDDVAVADLIESQGLPGEAHIAALGDKHGQAAVVVADAVDAGLSGLLDGSRVGVDAAVLELEKAVLQEPKNVPALAALAWAYAVSTDDEQQAHSATMLDRAVALDEGAAGVNRARAGLALASTSPRQAQRHAEACLSSAPEDGVCLWLQGRSLSQLGQADAAQESLERARAALGDVPAVRLGIGLAAIEGMRLDQALPELKAYLKQHPDHSGAQNALARVYQLGGQPNKALKFARSALKLEPQDEKLRERVAALELELGQGSASLQTLKPLLERKSPSEEALLIASWAALDARRLVQAGELSERLLLLTPSSARAHLLAATLAKRNGQSQALGALTGAKPDLMGAEHAARYHLAVAELYRADGELRSAEDAIRLALERRPSWVSAQVALAEVLLESGNVAGATQVLEALWKAHPDPERPFVVGLPLPTSRYSALELGLKQVPVGNVQHEPAQSGIATLQATQCVAFARSCALSLGSLQSLLARDDTLAGPGAWLAQVLLQMGSPGAALARLDQSIVQQGTESTLLLLRGQAKAASGGSPKDDLEQCLRRATGQLGVRGQIAQALLRAGDVDAAVSQARLALQQDSDDLLARQTLLAVGERGR
ncbi:MAG: tetratricopeptide (TPR) repeat protein [Cognaticolwellia sp.]|jgi:tetratricopeptide (TPR) repeat protein